MRIYSALLAKIHIRAIRRNFPILIRCLAAQLPESGDPFQIFTVDLLDLRSQTP